MLLLLAFLWRRRPEQDEPYSPGRIKVATPDTQKVNLTKSIEEQIDIKGRPASMPDPEDLEAGYEVSDWDLGGSINLLIAMFIFAAVAFGVVTGFQWLLSGEMGDFKPPVDGVASDPEGPIPDMIQSRALTGLEYQQLRATEDEWLSSYGWVDEQAGVVRIPVERAMDVALERGLLPSRPMSEGEGSFQDNAQELPMDSSSGRVMEMTSP